MFTPETVWGLVIFGKICIFKGIFLSRNVYSRLRIWLSCLHTEPKFSPSAPPPIGGITSWAWWDVSELELPSTQYPKFRSRPRTQPLGHVGDNLGYAMFSYLLVKIKIKFKLFILKCNGVISFLVLKTIQIDVLYMFLCSLFQKLWWNS